MGVLAQFVSLIGFSQKSDAFFMQHTVCREQFVTVEQHCAAIEARNHAGYFSPFLISKNSHVLWKGLT